MSNQQEEKKDMGLFFGYIQLLWIQTIARGGVLFNVHICVPLKGQRQQQPSFDSY